jgi:hypothetical protein
LSQEAVDVHRLGRNRAVVVQHPRKVRAALKIATPLYVLAVCALVFACVEPTRAGAEARVRSYSSLGYYVGPMSEQSNISPPKIILNALGVPVVRYGDLGYHNNPVTASQYGLWAYGLYLRDHDAPHREIALHVADWLVKHQRNGRWFYDFDTAVSGVPIKKPWTSAMAQGQAMSLLERAFHLTREKRYRKAALRALVPLRLDVTDGGLVRCFFGDCSRPFFEEAPTTPPSYILNGFMFTLIGLYDLASIAPKSDALSMYAAGRRTLDAALPRYDVDGLAAYDLTHLTARGHEPTIASQSYQAVHVYLLRTLDSLASDARLRHYANRWEVNAVRADSAQHRRRTWGTVALIVVAVMIAIGLTVRLRTRSTAAESPAPPALP